MECYSAIKKGEILPFATIWMNLGGIMLSEISQMEKGKYMSSLTCGIWRKKELIEADNRGEIGRTEGEMDKGANCVVTDGN